MKTHIFQKQSADAYKCLNKPQIRSCAKTLEEQELSTIVRLAINQAKKKSSPILLDIPEGTPELEAEKIIKKSGQKLYSHFKEYFNDPAAKALQCRGKHYTEVAREALENCRIEQEALTIALRNKTIEEALIYNSYSVPCDEIASAILNELIQSHSANTRVAEMSEGLANAFGVCCRKDGLLNSEGFFDDPYKLVHVLCGSES